MLHVLTDRKQQVTVNGSKLAVFDVLVVYRRGVGPGSVIFVIYTNSMVAKPEISNLYVYADDLKIFNEIKGEEDVKSTRICKYYERSQYSFLKFHPDKCVRNEDRKK